MRSPRTALLVLALLGGSLVSARQPPSPLDTPLIQACVRGDLAAVKRLAAPEEINRQDKNYNDRDATSMALRAGHAEIVMYLLAHGARPRWVLGIPPLHVAVLRNDVKTARRLLDGKVTVEDYAHWHSSFDEDLEPHLTYAIKRIVEGGGPIDEVHRKYASAYIDQAKQHGFRPDLDIAATELDLISAIDLATKSGFTAMRDLLATRHKAPAK